MRNRKSSGGEVAFWMAVLTALGAASGYFTGGRGGHVPAPTMALVGATWGAFIGVLFSMEISSVPLRVRQYVGAGLGFLASAICGYLLGLEVLTIVGIGVVAAILGVIADRWVKHITDFP